ncbi:MAG: glycoside hydrolase domain-containing protein, partial [Promethearchaeota archaeon]
MTKNIDQLYSIAEKPWDAWLGHHRVTILVGTEEDAVRVRIPWRRRDENPRLKRIVIIHKESNSQIYNIYIRKISKDLGDIVFQPKFGKGTYFLYYLPFYVQDGDGYYFKTYKFRLFTANPFWFLKNQLFSKKKREKLHLCTDFTFEARSPMDSFYPMEIPATTEELSQFFNKHPDELLIFPEDREYPIRMIDALPVRWIENGPSDTYTATIKRNEFFTFQLGLYSKTLQLTNVNIKFSDLINENNSVTIESSAMTCFNKNGVDPEGNNFDKIVNVPKNGVQPLWIGLDVPETPTPGLYNGTISIYAGNNISRKIHLNLTIINEISEDRSDDTPELHSRLRWLNSTHGLDKKVIPGFTPLEIDGNTIRYSKRALTLDQYGFPSQISGNGNLLSSPMDFFLSRESKFNIKKSLEIRSISENRVEWSSQFQNSSCTIQLQGFTESDGYCNYKISLIPLHDMNLKNVQFRWELNNKNAQYFMGFGFPGSKFPSRLKLRWKRLYNNFWVGNHKVGMCIKLLGASYSGPLLKLYSPKPPKSWYNNNKAFIQLSDQGEDVKIIEISTGSRSLKKGNPLEFKFDLLITPFKSIDPAGHFTNRYYHHSGKPNPSDDDVKVGVKIVNVHHANEINPYINYPWHTGEIIKEFVESNHKRGLKVKLYYTIRELTNYTTEIWALRSLGNEIFADGKGKKYIIGKGYPWLREHLKTDYEHAWYAHLPNGTIDSAIVTSGGKSRWLNYYIEGLAWMLKNYDIDGLYLDDVSFGRNILLRMRKVMEEIKPGECVIDLHSNTGFSKGPATKYMEFFPYVDKLWFGESFKYNQMSADNWFVEVSGIPFGLMGEMLQGGGNRWLGMVYGMSTRLPWISES